MTPIGIAILTAGLTAVWFLSKALRAGRVTRARAPYNRTPCELGPIEYTLPVDQATDATIEEFNKLKADQK